MNKLETYIRKNDLNYSTFGKLIGISRDRIRKYAKCEIIPKKETMEKIKEITNGFVQANDFYNANIKNI